MRRRIDYIESGFGFLCSGIGLYPIRGQETDYSALCPTSKYYNYCNQSVFHKPESSD